MADDDLRPRSKTPFDRRKGSLIVIAMFVVYLPVAANAQCRGYTGPGGACYTGPGGGLYTGPGGGAYTGPGGGLYTGPGGGMYTGPGGGLYTGPGGGAYTGPGGGAYSGPPSPDDQNTYKGPWSPCITGVKGPDWTRENCPD